jgi:uncharacterized protein (TIRG00374 family)
MNPPSNDSRNSSAGGKPRLSGPVRTALLILFSAVILVGVVAVVGFRETLDGLERAGITAFLALGLLQVVIVTLQTVAWAILNRPVGHRVGAKTLFEANLVGYAVNVITPSAYLGGEPAKVLYVGRRTGLSYTGLAGTIVLAKYMEAISFFLFFTAATIVSVVSFRDEIFSSQYLPVGVVLSVLGSVLLIVCVALWLSLVRKRHPLTRFVALVSRLRPKSRFFAKLRNRTRRMENQVNQVFTEHGRSAFQTFGVFLAVHGLIFVRPALFILITDGVLLHLGEIGLLGVAAQGLLAFQFTPGSVGTLDGGMLGVFSLLQLKATTCMAFLLITRFWDTLIVGFGAFFGAKVGAGMLSGRPSGEEMGLPSDEPVD